MLWSGDKLGMRKGVVQGVESKGTVGHYRGGKVYLPDPQQVRDLLPKRYRKAFDAQVHWQGLPQVWMDARNKTAPLTIFLRYKRNSRIMLQLYFQPLTEES
tara:strand:- start:294 stop:596 length:303 start_codon:yes stop_codon:yes gene_type:complete